MSTVGARPPIRYRLAGNGVAGPGPSRGPERHLADCRRLKENWGQTGQV
jgi:hypothetical protein